MHKVGAYYIHLCISQSQQRHSSRAPLSANPSLSGLRSNTLELTQLGKNFIIVVFKTQPSTFLFLTIDNSETYQLGSLVLLSFNFSSSISICCFLEKSISSLDAVHEAPISIDAICNCFAIHPACSISLAFLRGIKRAQLCTEGYRPYNRSIYPIITRPSITHSSARQFEDPDVAFIPQTISLSLESQLTWISLHRKHVEPASSPDRSR